MENIDLTAAGGWSAAATAALVAGYHALRKIKGDVRVDKVDDASQKLIDNLMTQHDKDISSIERLAKERNTAVERMGSLETTIKFQTAELERMSTEVVKLEDKVRELFMQNQHYMGEIDALRTENKTITIQNDELLRSTQQITVQMIELQETMKLLVAAAKPTLLP